MKVYLVGGAVRDELLGLPATERDYVVVGSSREEMLQQGFRLVGRDFPVFLHPETSAEYALARTERKIGPGHRGFECHASPDVTLEEDLLRRDLTINAIAKDADGVLIDPFGGLADLNEKLLRHVSPAFSEDPLRILRLARFKARFHASGFRVHDATTSLVTQMVAEDQLNELAPERILAEMDKALVTAHPAVFFFYLQETGGNKTLWPEISATGLERLDHHSPQVNDIESRFALLLADRDRTQIESLGTRLKCTRARTEITTFITTHIEDWANLATLEPKEILAFLYRVDALRRSERFTRFNAVAADIAHLVSEHAALATGRNTTSPGNTWIELRDIARAVKASTITTAATGPELGEAIKQEQIARITRSRKR